MFIARSLLLFLFLLLSQATPLQAQVPDDSIDVFIRDQAARFHVPGIAVGVVKQDSLIWSKGYGWADLERKIPMRTDGVMNIASISKTITATAVMQLWERGRIDLDTDINQYVPVEVRNPHFPEKALTIRHLLTHTSSIRDGSAYRKGYACGDPKVSLDDWIESYFSPEGEFYNSEENFHKESPGSIYRYSNVGFGLLGYIVEQQAGVSFSEFVKENIFNPLEMDNTGYYLREIDSEKRVVPYLYLGPLQKQINASSDTPLPYFNPYCMYSFWNYPDGLVRTSVEDLSHFAMAYMNGGEFRGKRILEEKTIAMMHSPQLSEALNDDLDQGLSWFFSPGLDPSWFHGGADPGVSTRLYVDKANKVGIIVFQNANADNAFFIARKLYNTFK
ncbi:MAG: beta-lactamase family protein [Rhodothermaceae bacterium]|nr:beta-lactamase family protein [Rhodothermaceae bacterium]